jgi:hypothetical protein
MPQLLADNLAALRETNPSLADRLARLGPADQLDLQPSRSGPPTVRVAGSDGVARLLHSAYDPLREAKALVDANLHPDALCYVLCGFGLGYAAAEMLDRLPDDAAVVAAEPSDALLAAAFGQHDFSAAIRARRLVFLTSPQLSHVHEQLGALNLHMAAGLRLVVWPAAEATAGPFFAEVRKAVTDYVAFARMTLVTVLINHEKTLVNVANNLGRYVTTPPMEILRNRFPGRCAVVISAGPSLNGSLPTLRRIADRVVLIAVQTALRPLLDAGIRPHFVTTLDYGEVGAKFFQDLPAGQLAGVHLVAEPKAHWKVVDTFAAAVEGTGRPAMISMNGNDSISLLLGDAAVGRDKLPPGATVAHLAFYLAQYMGCNPIVFVGQDLGFTHHSYYTPGTAIHRVWSGELNRFNSIESMEWQRIVGDPADRRELPDIFGQPIYTDEHMFVYLQQFERDFAAAARAGQRIIDATGGGVRKAGAEIMDFGRVAEQFAAEPLPADALAYRTTANWNDSSRLPAAVAAIERRIAQISQLAEVCGRTMDLLARLVELLPIDLAAFNRTVKEIDTQRDWVREHDDVLRTVALAAQVAEYRRFTADRSLRVQGVEGLDKRRIQLARDQAYVSAIRDGCKRMTEILREALARVKDDAGTPGRRDAGTGEAT